MSTGGLGVPVSDANCSSGAKTERAILQTSSLTRPWVGLTFCRDQPHVCNVSLAHMYLSKNSFIKRAVIGSCLMANCDAKHFYQVWCDLLTSCAGL